MQTPEARSLELTLGGRTVTLETGRIARQADGAVLVREGENVVLVTVVGAKEPRPGVDFFPLTVEYREKMAAGGRIPGGFTRREGRISDAEILTCRVIDRSLRPLFPTGYRAEVQIQATVFSAHPSADIASLALLGAGAALGLSAIPFDGPVVGARSALYRDRTTLLPVAIEREDSTADLVVSTGPHGLVMVEGEAREVPADSLLEHLLATIDALEKPTRELTKWIGEHGDAKRDFAPEEIDAAWRDRVRESCEADVREAIQIPGKHARGDRLREILDAHSARVASELGDDHEEVSASPDLFWKLQKQLVRSRVVHDGKRLDGRGTEDIRGIWGETRLLPRAHGSALFTRGETQALVSCTLGAPRDAMLIDSAQGKSEAKFLLHYNFPPYSVGEARPLRGPGRREIGHGNLALRGLTCVMPQHSDFPYTIRVESDITESNGSSSMATVCGGCLALMDAGVPIARPVAGIAMGLIEEDGQIAVLSDILGDEDHLGDMDFKITGTSQGITAVQMDNKIGGLTREVLEKAVAQARAGLDHILEKMQVILDKPREDVADHAPQVKTIRIQEHMVGALIGPKGSSIKAIQEASGATVTIGDEGLVTVHASEGAATRKALEAIRMRVGEVRVGETYRASVVGVKDFGCFVKIFESAEGLVPREKLGGRSLEQGEEVQVRVAGVDTRGRLQLELAQPR